MKKTDILFLKTEETRWHQFSNFYACDTAYNEKEWEYLLSGLDKEYAKWDEEEKWGDVSDELFNATEEEKYAFLLKRNLDIVPLFGGGVESLTLGQTVAVREYYYYQSSTVQLYKIKELL